MNWRTGIASIIIGLIVNIVSELLGITQRINPVDTGILNNVWIRGAIITATLAFMIYGLLSYLNKREKRFRKRTHLAGLYPRENPKKCTPKVK